MNLSINGVTYCCRLMNVYNEEKRCIIDSKAQLVSRLYSYLQKGNCRAEKVQDNRRTVYGLFIAIPQQIDKIFRVICQHLHLLLLMSWLLDVYGSEVEIYVLHSPQHAHRFLYTCCWQSQIIGWFLHIKGTMNDNELLTVYCNS